MRRQLIAWVGCAGAIALLASPHIAWINTRGLEAGIPSTGIAPGSSLVGWLLTAAALVAGGVVLAITALPQHTTHGMTGALLLLVVGASATAISVDKMLASVDWIRTTNDRFGEIARASIGVGGIVGVLGGIAVIVAGFFAVRATRAMRATTARSTASPAPEPTS